ncbi:winged helix-turn-helix transcriptional regulator [Hymenobacter terrenus]|uniref:winged helix-turn-helix transcriptional regulator n=1 Tax=Hymenobacter terrenus TaxID=1629124 RepID=UPI000698529F|nr:winged helix-turn-helix transcriptional regulator [Hymenobacter terrenus]
MAAPSPDKSSDLLLDIFDFFSERWVLFAISSLMGGPRNFNDLGRDCGGASGKVLIQKLEKMERLGIVERSVLSVIPPRTRYTLQPAGLALRPTIEALDHWARTHLPAPLNWEVNQSEQAVDESRSPIQLLQQKWVLRIVHALLKTGGSGYNKLSRLVGVNVTTLGHRLREMEEAAIISKTVVKVQPLQYWYELTASGAALKEVINAVEVWVDDYQKARPGSTPPADS